MLRFLPPTPTPTSHTQPDVAEAIDRQHRKHIRDVVLPKVVPAGGAQQQLEAGCTVADLGCGGGNLLVAMAERFPRSEFHGFEVSDAALACAARSIAASSVAAGNTRIHDANAPGESGDEGHRDKFDVVMTYDVLHDAPNPVELVAQVRAALKPGGVWLLADIACLSSVRDNVCKLAGAGVYYAFSLNLCMSCALSTEDGAGLGTLGFTVPVAEKMLGDAGFDQIEVLLEADNTRWFLAR